MPTRLPRWTWLPVLPMLVGALVFMHGLDVRASDSHQSEASASAGIVEEHPHEQSTPADHLPSSPIVPSSMSEHPHEQSTPADHRHCVGCLAGHVMVACVAIITAIGGVGLVRRLMTSGSLAASAAAVADRVRGLVELARPPDPAWVRLSVIRR